MTQWNNIIQHFYPYLSPDKGNSTFRTHHWIKISFSLK